MKKCYHSDCDQWNQSIATDDKYKFMTATAQSLVFSIVEMTMEDHANRHLFLPTFHHTCIFGAYGPIMFALRVWIGFGASWRGGPLC